MTRTGRTLNEYLEMGATGVVALVSFFTNLPLDSATRIAMNPKDDRWVWETNTKTNAILADIYDVYSAVHAKKGRTPKPYPRPGEHKGIGRDAIPISQFWDWWNKGD